MERQGNLFGESLLHEFDLIESLASPAFRLSLSGAEGVEFGAEGDLFGAGAFGVGR